MAQEMYFLYLNGVQRGPYTVHQIGHMVNSGIVESEAMFWCEGLDQWQPVTQLITPKAEERRKRWRLGGYLGAFVVFLLGALWWLYPLLHQGWMEQHQVEWTEEAAYWRARGVLREHLGRLNALSFGEFDAGKVSLRRGEDSEVGLLVGATNSRTGGPISRWCVKVFYDEKLRAWVPSKILPHKD